jgi:hypothetical protein
MVMGSPRSENTSEKDFDERLGLGLALDKASGRRQGGGHLLVPARVSRSRAGRPLEAWCLVGYAATFSVAAMLCAVRHHVVGAADPLRRPDMPNAAAGDGNPPTLGERSRNRPPRTRLRVKRPLPAISRSAATCSELRVCTRVRPSRCTRSGALHRVCRLDKHLTRSVSVDASSSRCVRLRRCSTGWSPSQRVDRRRPCVPGTRGRRIPPSRLGLRVAVPMRLKNVVEGWQLKHLDHERASPQRRYTDVRHTHLSRRASNTPVVA